MIGFLTRESLEDLPGVVGAEDTVAVFLPMSYQVGGHTVLVPRSAVLPIDLPFETAMRFVLTAGISTKPVAFGKPPADPLRAEG
jgi:uncharacterized membrane protein